MQHLDRRVITVDKNIAIGAGCLGSIPGPVNSESVATAAMDPVTCYTFRRKTASINKDLILQILICISSNTT